VRRLKPVSIALKMRNTNKAVPASRHHGPPALNLDPAVDPPPRGGLNPNSGWRGSLSPFMLSRGEGEGPREITIYFEVGVNPTALQ
jgi:hypothetical protein